jgi:hypothetical protein
MVAHQRKASYRSVRPLNRSKPVPRHRSVQAMLIDLAPASDVVNVSQMNRIVRVELRHGDEADSRSGVALAWHFSGNATSRDLPQTLRSANLV